MDRFNIPRHYIFDSRDTAFQEDIQRETNGYGVNVVLNSLSGELLQASWRCVAKFGYLLETGITDLVGNGVLSLERFQEGRSFIGIDFYLFSVERPDESRR